MDFTSQRSLSLTDEEKMSPCSIESVRLVNADIYVLNSLSKQSSKETLGPVFKNSKWKQLILLFLYYDLLYNDKNNLYCLVPYLA